MSLAISLGAPLDETKCKNAQFFLYKHKKPWDLPPFKTFTYDQAFDYIVQIYDEDERNAMDEALKHYLDPETVKWLVEANSKKKLYFSQFPGIQNFIKSATETAKKRGFLRTWTGRRRHFRDPQKEGYKGPNFIIQGGCGDILKVKLPELEAAVAGTKSSVVNLIHDEVMFMVHKSELHLIDTLKDILQDLPFMVPISCGFEWSLNWGEKNENKEELHDFSDK